MRHLLTVCAVTATLALAGCGGGDEPTADPTGAASSSSAAGSDQTPTDSGSSSPADPAAPTFTAPADPDFCAAAADDTLDTAQPGTQEYADGTAALADVAPDEIKDAAEVLRTLGEVQLGLGTDGTPEELQAAMTEQGVDAVTLLNAFGTIGAYIDTCNS